METKYTGIVSKVSWTSGPIPRGEDLASKDEKRKSESTDPEDSVRKRIIAGARRNFFTHGLRGVTMDDLAAEIGMSKKTLYAHFPSKTALVEATLLDKFREVESELELITSDCSTDYPGVLQRVLAFMQGHTGEMKPPFLRDIEPVALFETLHRLATEEPASPQSSTAYRPEKSNAARSCR